KAVALEELGVVGIQKRAVGRDREADRNASLQGDPGGELGGAPDQGAIGQRLAAEKGKRHSFAEYRVGEQATNRGLGDIPFHASRGTTEAAALGIAVGAAKGR